MKRLGLLRIARQALGGAAALGVTLAAATLVASDREPAAVQQEITAVAAVAERPLRPSYLVPSAPPPINPEDILAEPMPVNGPGVALAVASTEAAPAGIEPAEGRDVRIVSADALNVRAAPTSRSEKAFRLSQGDAVEVIGEQGSWLEVQTPSGETGWAYAKYLAVKP